MKEKDNHVVIEMDDHARLQHIPTDQAWRQQTPGCLTD